MTDVLIVLCTFSSWDEARQIGTQLVERQYAACVNILPGVESIYRWNGEVCREDEVMGVIKTTRQAFVSLSEEIHRRHSYDEPEIIALPVEGGSPGYLAWLSSCVDF